MVSCAFAGLRQSKGTGGPQSATKDKEANDENLDQTDMKTPEPLQTERARLHNEADQSPPCRNGSIANPASDFKDDVCLSKSA